MNLCANSRNCMRINRCTNKEWANTGEGARKIGSTRISRGPDVGKVRGSGLMMVCVMGSLAMNVFAYRKQKSP